MPNLGGSTSFTGIQVGDSSSATGSAASYPVGTPLYWKSAVTIPVVALTMTATKSTETTFTVLGARQTNSVVVTPYGSALSAGLALTGSVTADNTITLRYSNVSTANAAQVAHTVLAVFEQY